MPHVSKHKVTEPVRRDLEDRLIALIVSSGSNARKHVFRELLTGTESLMVAKRIAIIALVDDGMQTHKISEMLRVSPSTVARFEHMVERGLYKQTIAWIRRVKIGKPFLQLLTALAAIPFEAQHKSLAQLSKDW